MAGGITSDPSGNSGSVHIRFTYRRRSQLCFRGNIAGTTGGGDDTIGGGRAVKRERFGSNNDGGASSAPVDVQSEIGVRSRSWDSLRPTAAAGHELGVRLTEVGWRARMRYGGMAFDLGLFADRVKVRRAAMCRARRSC